MKATETIQGEQQQYTIEYLKIDSDTFKNITLLELESIITGDRAKLLELKTTLLRKLGIELQDGEKPIDAYSRYLCELNNLPVTKPIDRSLADVIAATPAAMRMLYILA
jgi:hypothetical protein